MAWAKSATPTADLRLADRETVCCAAWQQRKGSWRRAYVDIQRDFLKRDFTDRGLSDHGSCRHNQPAKPWPLNRYATIASLIHLILLTISGILQFWVTPAQASAGSTLGSPLHLGLLVLSGTAAALLMLAANHQRRAAPWWPFGGEAICQTNLATSPSPEMSAAESDAATGLPLLYDGICQAGSADHGTNNCIANSHQRDCGQHNRNQPADHWAELMARASHELRTPLNAVIGFSDVMQRELLGPIAHERYREYIAHIRESGFALLRSTEDTLALTNLIGKTDAAQLCDVELDPVVRDAWLAVPHNAANPHVELIADLDKDTVIRCNKAALRQALINLFADAICQAAPRSPLTLKLRTDGAAITVTLSCQCRDMKRQSDLHNALNETNGLVHKKQSDAIAPQDQPRQSELPLVMARALLTLQGAELALSPGGAAHWTASITFKCDNGAPINLSAHVPAGSEQHIPHNGQLH